MSFNFRSVGSSVAAVQADVATKIGAITDPVAQQLAGPINTALGQITLVPGAMVDVECGGHFDWGAATRSSTCGKSARGIYAPAAGPRGGSAPDPAAQAAAGATTGTP